MKNLLFVCALAACFEASAQLHLRTDSVKAPSDYENIYVQKLFSDSLASSFVIFIKKEVKAHKHVEHTEQVFILEGNGEMQLGEKKITVRPGDMIVIPKGTEHSLKTLSEIPVKVISIQAPFFDGKDRVMID